MLRAKISSFKYKDTLILRDVDLSFEKGKTYGIVGLNGAGKTTFFNLVAGFIKSPGAVFSYDERAVLRSDIAFMDTDLFFYPKLTAREFLSVFPMSSADYNEEKLAQLFKFPLDGFMEEFSTGMKKKLLLQSQIKQDKHIYILDEPFNGLDLETNKILEVIIGILNERGKTVLVSSHILEPLLTICSQIHYLKEQRVFKTYDKESFPAIEHDLFGAYSREIKSELLKII